MLNAKSRIIVVDSIDSIGSNDDTEALCLRYDVVYLKSPKSHRAIQLNLGATQSTADAIMFVHADVFPPKNFSSLIKNCLSKSDCGMFAYRFDRKGLMFSFNSFFTQFNGFFAGGGDQCFFIKRSVFDHLGGYDEDYSVMEDFDFFRRIKHEKFSFEILKTKALVSARKYSKHSYLKINWCNAKMLYAFYRGDGPLALEERYLRYKIAYSQLAE